MPTDLLAHAGGWDELLLAAGIVLAFLGASAWRGRRRRQAPGEAGRAAARPGFCPYCEAALPSGAGRCPACGFRVPERP